MQRLITLTLSFILAHSAIAATDRVIQPNVQPRAVSTNGIALDPIIDRSGAREIARLRAKPVVIQEQLGKVVDGVVQSLEHPIRIALPKGSAFAPEMLGRITIAGAEETRIRFRDAPPGTVLWLAGSDDEAFIRYEPSMTATWGPTTRGSIVYIAAESGEGTIEIAELANIAAVSQAQSSCISDVNCRSSEDFAPLGDASRAIGQMRFVSEGKTYVCTGGLVNDASSSGTPYFLTAHHCVSTREEAASLEVIWDLKTESCGSNRITKGSRSNGAEILATSDKTDVTLLKLAAIPSGRVFLGIDTRALAAGTVIHRVSHPGGNAQSYSSGVVEQGGMSCSSAPRPRFVYTQTRTGATSGGSSGAPFLVNGLYVAGQLLGTCGPDPSNVCATYNRAVDGAMRESWPLLSPHLDPLGLGVRRRAVR